MFISSHNIIKQIIEIMSTVSPLHMVSCCRDFRLPATFSYIHYSHKMSSLILDMQRTTPNMLPSASLLRVLIKWSCTFQVNYFPSRYDPCRHAETYPIPSVVLKGKRDKVCVLFCFVT